MELGPRLFGPKMACASLVAISGQKKSLDFQGTRLSMALVMDLPSSKSLRLAPNKQQVH